MVMGDLTGMRVTYTRGRVLVCSEQNVRRLPALLV